MKCLKEKCIHHAVCALYTYSGYASDECGFYETRPHGEWVFKYDNPLIKMGYWECSKCKTGRLMVEENFCPNCGADMRKEGEPE